MSCTCPANLEIHSWNYKCLAEQEMTPYALSDVRTMINWVIVKARKANSGMVWVGNSTDQYFELDAGEEVRIVTSDLGSVYVRFEMVGDSVDVLYG